MVESETLQFDNARTLQNLYANDFKLLQALEEKLAVKVTTRDGWLRVEGERPNIEKTRRVFDQLEEARTRIAPSLLAAHRHGEDARARCLHGIAHDLRRGIACGSQ